MSAARDPLRRSLDAEPPAWLDALVVERASAVLAQSAPARRPRAAIGASSPGSRPTLARLLGAARVAAERARLGAPGSAWRRLQQLASAFGARASAAAPSALAPSPRELGRLPRSATLSDSTS